MCPGRYLPEKAIDLVDEACANVKVQLNSRLRKFIILKERIQLEIELHALEKENDKACEARIVEVGSKSLKND